MTTTFPNAVDSFDLLEDGTDSPLAAHQNDRADAIVATQNYLLDSFPEGVLVNGVIFVEVQSSDLYVWIKTLAGTNPSTTDPVYIRLNGTVRKITSSLSVVKADGTNWANLGGSELAAKLVNLFVYIGYNTTDGVVVGWSRIPGARKYSDFSTTSTNEKYAAISTITSAAADDFYTVVGRFSATLSAGAGYTWSVSGTGDIVQRPIFETDWLTYLPVYTNLTTTSGTLTARYLIDRKYIYVEIDFIFGASSAISGAVSFTLPYTNASAGQAHPQGLASLVDNGTGTTYGNLEYNTSTSMRIRAVNASGTYATMSALSSTVPFTWVSGDEISVSGKYRY